MGSTLNYKIENKNSRSSARFDNSSPLTSCLSKVKNEPATNPKTPIQRIYHWRCIEHNSMASRRESNFKRLEERMRELERQAEKVRRARLDADQHGEEERLLENGACLYIAISIPAGNGTSPAPAIAFSSNGNLSFNQPQSGKRAQSCFFAGEVTSLSPLCPWCSICLLLSRRRNGGAKSSIHKRLIVGVLDLM